MRISRYLIAIVIIVLCPCLLLAQNNNAGSDGTIIERAPHVFPTYEQLPVWTKRIYTKEAYEGFRNSPNLELIRIKYMSEGLRVVGFIYKPKVTEGKKLPVIIYNRGGLGEDAKIANSNFRDVYEMYRYSSEGFVVIASQYRGIDGGEGKDEVGGADLGDVMNLVPLAKSLGYADMDRMFIWGASRGALMALQAIKLGLPVKAAVVVGTPADFTDTLKRNPFIIGILKNALPDFESRREEHIKNRSAVRWADRITVPLLIFQGGDDPGTPPAQALEFAQKLEDHGKLYELVIYARDDHFVTLHREERLRRTIDWFNNPRKMSITKVIWRTIREQNVETAIRQYHDLKKTQNGKYDFSEAQLNQLGYELLGLSQIREAIEIFKLNVTAFPESFITYDSLGEAYMINGERELAIKNYRRSLELNPQNTSAVEALKRLNQK